MKKTLVSKVTLVSAILCLMWFLALPEGSKVLAASTAVVPTTNFEMIAGDIGHPAPAGTLIQAFCNTGTIAAETTLEKQQDKYRLTVYGQDQNTSGSEKNCRDDQQIHFLVNGQEANASPQTGSSVNFKGGLGSSSIINLSQDKAPGTKLVGDINGDGTVDIFDYNKLVEDFGPRMPAGGSPADLDRDGDVDIFDYNLIVGNFGKSGN